MAYRELCYSDFLEISFSGFFLEREIIVNALVYEYVVFVVALNALRSFPVLFG